jgi:hypothetical protein
MVYKVSQSFEKRKSPRVNWINLEVQVVLKSINADSKILGWIQDISRGGFKVRAETPSNSKGLFQKWNEFYFETFENFFEIKGQGRIVWTSSMEIGIKFNQLDEESRRFVDGFLGIFP